MGRYELGRTLGEGTFAKVKFARNVETGDNVAIKILDKEKVMKHKMIGQVNFTNIFSLNLMLSSVDPFCFLDFYHEYCRT